MTSSKLLACSLVLVILLLPLAAAQEPAGSAGLKIVSKSYSAGHMPTVGSYVQYKVELSNTGDSALQDRSLKISLVSEDGKTNSSASYAVEFLGHGESRMLYLGPFKMEDEGKYQLLAELDGAYLHYSPDSFPVYRQEAIQTAVIAIPLMASGAGLIGFSFYRKKKTV